MPNNHYARGAQFERKVKDYLESKGYYAVRAAGSHGLTDVLAVKYTLASSHTVLFIQCKTGKARMSKKDRDNLFTSAGQVNAIPLEATPDGNLITFNEITYNGTLKEAYI